MTTVFTISEMIIFIILAINIFYLLIFSLASLFKTKPIVKQTNLTKRIAILIPAYKEDAVIMECVETCLRQNYPKHSYDTVVISDKMEDQTNAELAELPLTLVKVNFESSTKAKALNFAMHEIGDKYDIAIILDADNTISPDFLKQINETFDNKEVQIVQAHRCAKNTNTPLALLDAVSEEINNSIFRKGHANMGLSAALIGSGMAFNYTLFKQTMLTIDAVGGFDRALELTLMRQGVRVFYLPYSDVLDEKVQRSDDFSRQRRRWMSAQLHYLRRSYKQIPKALIEGRWDFCDKVFQQVSIPRLILIGFSFIFAAGMTLISTTLAVKWWVMFGVLVVAMMLAIPKKLVRTELLMAIIQLPYFFLVMVANLFKLKGANKKFIHTKHGVKK